MGSTVLATIAAEITTTKSLEAPQGILDRGSASRSLNMLDNLAENVLSPDRLSQFISHLPPPFFQRRSFSLIRCHSTTSTLYTILSLSSSAEPRWVSVNDGMVFTIRL